MRSASDNVDAFSRHRQASRRVLALATLILLFATSGAGEWGERSIEETRLVELKAVSGEPAIVYQDITFTARFDYGDCLSLLRESPVEIRAITTVRGTFHTLLGWIESEARDSSEIDLGTARYFGVDVRRLVFSLLLRGRATVFLHGASSRLNQLHFERFVDNPGIPLGSSGGRLLRSPDGTILLEIQDWIS